MQEIKRARVCSADDIHKFDRPPTRTKLSKYQENCTIRMIIVLNSAAVIGERFKIENCYAPSRVNVCKNPTGNCKKKDTLSNKTIKSELGNKAIHLLIICSYTTRIEH